MAKPVVEEVTTTTPESADAPATQAEDKPKYDKTDLLAIFDDIMFEGSYKEDVLIRGKLKVTFVTRSAASVSEITRELDSKKFNLMSTLVEQKALLNICHSLIRYNDKDISNLKMEDRRAFVEKLPTVVVAAISNALVEFDLKTEAAMGEMDSF